MRVPNVVVGMPIYNGERYLADALESLIAQKYEDLSIFISDNASTDGSAGIINHYAKQDPRITCHRMNSNVGAIENFRFVLRETRSPYFMWAAHDDVWPHDFVASAVRIFEEEPATVLVNTCGTLIDADGKELPLLPTRPQLVDLRGLAFPDRIRQLATRVGWNIYGLAQRKCLLQTSALEAIVPYADVLITYELAGHGPFAIANTASPFQYRLVVKSVESVVASLGPSATTPTKWYTEMFTDCARAILRAPTTGNERQDAITAFIEVCSRHAEWWQGLSSENSWSDDLQDCARKDRLHSLL